MNILVKNLQRFRLITFDCTNTLLYFKYPPEVQYLKTAVACGIPEEKFDKTLMKANFRKQFKELNKIHPNFGRNSISFQKWWETLVTNVFVDSSHEQLDPELLKPIARKLIQQYTTKECWEKFHRSDELISDLKKLGKVVGVISNFDPRLHDILNDVNLTKIDFVVTSYEAGVEKPNAEIFHYAMKRSQLNVEPSEALHIGNELEKDVLGASNASWSSVLINAGKSNESHFKDIEEFWNVIRTKEINL